MMMSLHYWDGGQIRIRILMVMRSRYGSRDWVLVGNFSAGDPLGVRGTQPVQVGTYYLGCQLGCSSKLAVALNSAAKRKPSTSRCFHWLILSAVGPFQQWHSRMSGPWDFSSLLDHKHRHSTALKVPPLYLMSCLAPRRYLVKR